MPDPSTVRDMDKGAARLADAILRNEPIAVFGDYDVDGACSAALMQRFLAAHGLAARIYIPDRMTEGYGPEPRRHRGPRQGRRQADRHGRLRHHQRRSAGGRRPARRRRRRRRPPPGRRAPARRRRRRQPQPPGRPVGPRRPVRRRRRLHAAGGDHARAAPPRLLRRRSAPRPPSSTSSTSSALATVCDVVPLKGLNRAYVTKGLQVMRQRRNTGLKALADAAGLAVPPTPYHLGFVLGPRINAGGRIGDAGARRAPARHRRRDRRPRASPCCSTSSTASARRIETRCWRRRWRAPSSWSRPIPTCPCC